jgi:hypothetical protein
VCRREFERGCVWERVRERVCVRESGREGVCGRECERGCVWEREGVPRRARDLTVRMAASFRVPGLGFKVKGVGFKVEG